MIELTLKVDGMMCGACEAHVADAVRKAANVKSVKASHASGRVDVVLEQEADAEKIVGAIEAEGYAVLEKSARPYQKSSLLSKLTKKRN